MTAAIARIALRYAAAALVAHGWLTVDGGEMLTMDPDVQMMVGFAVAAGVEAWYGIAKRLNWNT
jgi:hypothetical protein